MRHGKVGRKLKRTASHRRATLSALSISLLRHKRIRTTVAKAKETRVVVERLITRAKNAVAGETGDAPKNVHARRHVFSLLRDRAAVTTLFDEVAPKVSERAGGYTRVIKLGRRRGDGAEMAIIELVDFNVAAVKAAKSAKKTASRKATKDAEKDSSEPKAEMAGEGEESKSQKKSAAKAKPKTKGKKAGGKDTSSAKA